MRLSDDFIQEIKYRNDLAEVVQNYVPLKRSGRNLKGLCPFHNEKTPSFTVYSENGSFYCFGCGTGGDVITFIMKIENLDYMEAVKFLAQRAGMSMPEDDYDDSLGRLRTRILEANREAARFYHSVLYSPQGKAGLDYLRKRKLLDSTIKKFGLGFSPDSRFALSNHLRNKGFTDSEIVAANLAYPNKSGKGTNDRFYNRVMYPIIDLRGNVIGFGGRIMTDQKPKYLNTSDTMVFSKTHNLFSLCNAKNSDSKNIILCEGYMDVIAIYQAGFTNAVATLGTALTDAQAILLKRYTDEIVLCYDSDEAGQKATQRAIGILRQSGLNIKVLKIPNGKDPDEFIKLNGDKGTVAFKNLIESSGNDVEYRLLNIASSYNLNNVEGKLSYLSSAIKVLASLENSVERDVYASKLAQQTDVSRESIMEQIKKINYSQNKKQIKTRERQMQQDITARNDKVNPEKSDRLKAAIAEENLLCFLVNNPDKAKEIKSKITADDFVTDFNKNLFSYFLQRIEEGKEPMTLVSQEFPEDEVSRIYRLVSGYSEKIYTKDALDEYISNIKKEKSKYKKEDIEKASNEEIEDIIKKMRESHK